MTMPRKVRANQKNGQKAKGPITARGKAAASKNSLKHGFLSKELMVPAELKAEFDNLRSRLLTELKPNGVLQEFYFEEIVTCIWKLKLLLRFEMSQFSGIGAKEVEGERPASVPSELPGKRDLKAKIEFLEELKPKVQMYGDTALQGNYREPLLRLFGEEFYNSLMSWNTTGVFAKNFQEMAKRKAEMYGFEPPAIDDQKPESSTSPENAARVDSIERADMIFKLITERQNSLRELCNLRNHEAMQPGEALNARVDLQIRYSSALKRDLWKAILQFHELKDPSLI
jgi:hypothetical protein